MHLEYAYNMACPMKIVFILVYPKTCSEGFIEQRCYTENGCLATPRNTKNKKHLQSTQLAQPTNLTDQAPSTTERTAWETHNRAEVSKQL